MNQSLTHPKRWFASAGFDLGFFHVPVWLTWAIVFAVPASVRNVEISIWVWVSVVLLIDVGHVWSSIYRTYFDPTTRKTLKGPLVAVPLLCLVFCFWLAAQSNLLFWRVLAYIAVFHFVKQQIGIAALYRVRHQQMEPSHGVLMAKLWVWDKRAVYVGTVFPLVYWHCTLPRKISWFLQGDFVDLTRYLSSLPAMLLNLGKILFFGIWIGTLVIWLWHHVRARSSGLSFPLGKVLWIAGTAINWWLGLVYFDSDFVFTLTNVVAHGIPYFGLIGLYQSRRLTQQRGSRFPAVKLSLILMLPVLALAFFEEYGWDVFLYEEHRAFFGLFLPYLEETLTSDIGRALAIAVLSLPQTVHYVLDGFIWKFNEANPDLKTLLFPKPSLPEA